MSAPVQEASRRFTPARVLALALLLATVVGGAVTLASTFSNPAYGAGADSVAFGIVIIVLTADAAAFATAGLLIVWSQPGNTIGWILSAFGVLVITTFGGFALGSSRVEAAGPDDLFARLFSLMGVLSFFPAFVLLAALGWLFPDGHLPSPRWKVAVLIVLAPITAFELALAFLPGRLDRSLGENPLGIPLLAALEPLRPIIDLAANVALPAAFALSLLAVAVRFRRARGATREQHKWFLGAIAAIFALQFATNVDQTEGQDVVDVLAVFSLALLPISIGIAVLRYRLYEIDRLVSRTIGWAIVTGVLVTAFVLGLIGLQAILTSVTNTQGETLAVAASTLITLALFQPVRQRVQRAVDRRFDRARYDGERVVEAFAGRLRDQFDLDVLATEVGRVAAETVRPTMAVVWLRPVRRGRP